MKNVDNKIIKNEGCGEELIHILDYFTRDSSIFNIRIPGKTLLSKFITSIKGSAMFRIKYYMEHKAGISRAKPGNKNAFSGGWFATSKTLSKETVKSNTSSVTESVGPDTLLSDTSLETDFELSNISKSSQKDRATNPGALISDSLTECAKVFIPKTVIDPKPLLDGSFIKHLENNSDSQIAELNFPSSRNSEFVTKSMLDTKLYSFKIDLKYRSLSGFVPVDTKALKSLSSKILNKEVPVEQITISSILLSQTSISDFVLNSFVVFIDLPSHKDFENDSDSQIAELNFPSSRNSEFVKELMSDTKLHSFKIDLKYRSLSGFVPVKQISTSSSKFTRSSKARIPPLQIAKLNCKISDKVPVDDKVSKLLSSKILNKEFPLEQITIYSILLSQTSISDFVLNSFVVFIDLPSHEDFENNSNAQIAVSNFPSKGNSEQAGAAIKSISNKIHSNSLCSNTPSFSNPSIKWALNSYKFSFINCKKLIFTRENNQEHRLKHHPRLQTLQIFI